MKAKILLLISFGIFVFYVNSSYAQDVSPADSVLGKNDENKQVIREATQEVKKAAVENKLTLIQQLQEKRQEASKAARTNRETFKKRLQLIKDERKRAIIQRINEKIALTNETYIEKLAERIEALEGILERIKSKAEVAKSEGKDTADLDAAIINAQTAIDAAKTAITTQTGNTYTADILDENALRANVGETVSKFRSDLRVTHRAVVDAKQLVKKAASELAQISNASGINNNATTSAQ